MRSGQGINCCVQKYTAIIIMMTIIGADKTANSTTLLLTPHSYLPYIIIFFFCNNSNDLVT